ncbi:hypothetical protein ACFQZZ_14655 [Nocardia sp. GCM10030253]|uniref:hypothetical protein n=1 Tax=Nocardia sp. GCM10030253 TaxID=3273404 RepID=UPI0036407652
MRAFEGTRPNGIVKRLLGDRHSLPLSIVLHLVPGALIVAVYLLIGEPFVNAIGYPAFMGWAIALSLVLMWMMVFGFALYHFWSPWVFVSRVIFTFPGYWFAWRNKDIRLSVGMHVGVTSIVATLGTVAVALNLI